LINPKTKNVKNGHFLELCLDVKPPIGKRPIRH